MRNIWITTALLLGALSLAAAPLNGLYFGLDNMRGFAEVYWWFLSDGRVLHGLPKTGLTPQDFESACQASPPNCGAYTLTGAKLTIKYKSGESQDWTYKPLNGGFQMNYLILSEVKKYPSGTRLNGSWSRPYSAKFATSGSSTATVTSPTFLTFKSDGTYSENNITGLETQSTVKGASVNSSSASQASGTYTIQDYVLTLVKNGKSERHMIFSVADGNLNIDGQVYTKQK